MPLAHLATEPVEFVSDYSKKDLTNSRIHIPCAGALMELVIAMHNESQVLMSALSMLFTG